MNKAVFACALLFGACLVLIGWRACQIYELQQENAQLAQYLARRPASCPQVCGNCWHFADGHEECGEPCSAGC